jgi:FkbM family methyltransferase
LVVQTVLLRVLERGARVLRALGLGGLVDRLGPAIGAAAARTEVEIDGFRLVGSHAGHLFYLRELAEDDRERHLVELMRECVPEGGTAVEAGAHIGFVTLHLASRVGPSGRVWTFEANPEVHDTIRENLRLNGLADRVTLVESAVGRRAGRARFHLSGGGETSSLHDQGTTRREVEVQVTPIDAALPADAVADVVKLDIEGGELDALEGMRELVARSGERLTLFLECNPDALAAAGRSADELVRWLGERGFRLFRIDEGRRRLAPLASLPPGGEYVNLMCIPAGRAAPDLGADAEAQ